MRGGVGRCLSTWPAVAHSAACQVSPLPPRHVSQPAAVASVLLALMDLALMGLALMTPPPALSTAHRRDPALRQALCTTRPRSAATAVTHDGRARCYARWRGQGGRRAATPRLDPPREPREPPPTGTRRTPPRACTRPCGPPTPHHSSRSRPWCYTRPRPRSITSRRTERAPGAHQLHVAGLGGHQHLMRPSAAAI